jgi:hypothetical protein
MKVYLDVDGVLLGQKEGRVVLAAHAAELIEFLLEHFDVYWLTTHCSGDAQRVIHYLARFASPDFIKRLAPIKPTQFHVLKTEAVSGDFYWLDDSPLQAELAELQRRDLFDRWIDVNTRQRPDDLLFAMDELASVLQT